MPYEIIYSMSARAMIKSLTAADRSRLVDEVEAQLRHQAEVEAINRKRLRRNQQELQWELRIGHLRVLYNIEDGAVNIVYIGVKRNNKLFIEGREFPL